MKSFLTISAIILVVSVVLGGGFFYYRSLSHPNNTFDLNNIIQEATQTVTNKDVTPIEEVKEKPKTLMEFLKPTKIQDVITLDSGELLLLYKYKQPAKKFCNPNVEQCLDLPDYGDYVGGGYDCSDNPFFNKYDNQNWKIYTSGAIEVASNKHLSKYILKDSVNRCHLYTLRYPFQEDVVGFDPLKIIPFKISDKYITLGEFKLIQYYATASICSVGDFRIVESADKIEPFLMKIEDLSDNFDFFVFRPDTDFDFDTFRFYSFIDGVTREGQTGTLQTVLNEKPYGGASIDAQRAFFKKIATGFGIVYIKSDLFPGKYIGITKMEITHRQECTK